MFAWERTRPPKPMDSVRITAFLLDVGALRLRLVFKLTESDGNILATLDSPDQGTKGIPLDEVTLDGPTVKIASKKMKSLFAGKLMERSKKRLRQWR